MYTCNIAFTAPINPPTAHPQLTQSQVWAGLERKVRHAEEFVPVIVACSVVGEETLETGELVVTRTATFRGDDGGRDTGRTVKEVCVHLAPSRVDFRQEDGTTVSNIVSRGGEGELMMTYSFQWRFPDVEEGSEEAAGIETKYWAMAKVAVQSSIDSIRTLVKTGAIE